MVRQLLDLKADLESGVPNKHHTPLHTASDKSRRECVKLLLEAKAKLDAKDSGGETALMLAVR